MDPDLDPGYFFKIYWIFLTKQNFKIFVLVFSLIFMLKLDEPFRNQEIFIISLFLIVQIWVLRVNFFFLAVCGWYFAPWAPDPDLKHWFETYILSIMWRYYCRFSRFKMFYFDKFWYIFSCSRNALLTFVEKSKIISFQTYKQCLGSN